MTDTTPTLPDELTLTVQEDVRDVFLCHASHDAVAANRLVSRLETLGLRCWIAPRDVTPGSLYAECIVRAINATRVLVVLLSEEALRSPHVGKEIERASSKRRPIITVRLSAEPLPLSLEYFLSESHWLEARLDQIDLLASQIESAIRSRCAPERAEVPLAAASAGSAARPWRQRLVQGGALVAVLAVAAWAAVSYLRSRPAGSVAGLAASPIAIVDKSVAVLPFIDLSEKKDQEFFADGMSEDIVGLLTKIPGLKVIGRTSSFQFKGKSEDLRTIGAKLNAAYVLEGSVRKTGDLIRITAQLINSRSGATEWSETFNRSIGQVLQLQDEIAAAVVRELQITVAPESMQARSSLRNPDVYELILRGRHAADRWNKEGFEEARIYFQRALDREPTSADAALGLAWAYEVQGEWGFVPPAVAFEMARSNAQTAQKLDPKLAEAHGVLGLVHVIYDWDWQAAATEFSRESALAPGSAAALHHSAFLSFALGRQDEALRTIKAALVQDPLNGEILSVLCWIQSRRGKMTEAEAAMRRAIEIRPGFAWSHYYVGMIMLERGDRDGALLEMQKSTDDSEKRQGLAIAYYALGRRADSDAVLAQMLQEDAGGNAEGLLPSTRTVGSSTRPCSGSSVPMHRRIPPFTT